MAVLNATVVNKQETDSCKTENKSKQNEVVDFDDLLSSAGELGRYQVFLIIATIPFYFYGVVVYFSQLFLTEVSPNHWCWIPELENLTDIERRNLAIPSDDTTRFGYSHCTAYVANWTEVVMNGMKPDQAWNTMKCQHGWEFNKTEIPYPTISSEMEWVCDKNSYQASAQSIFFAGSIIGGFIIGKVADRFGRLPATVISCIFGFVGGTVSTFARDFTEFALCRFVMGFAYDNCMMMVYLLILEYIAPKYRTVVANVSFAMFYSISVTLFPWIALACGHWKTLSLVTSIPLAFGVLAPLIIPESSRWMVSKGRVDSAVNKILTIARVNRKEVPTKLIQEFKSSVASKTEEATTVLELLRRPVLRKMYICICLKYTCCSIIFDVLVRSIGQLDFDFFISFSVISFTELPSLILLAFVMDWMGRRWLAATSYAFGCIFCLLTVFIGSGLPSVICAVIARFSINMTYGAAMQWAAEMLPTPVRGSGISIVHICGLVGTLTSPYIVYLETLVYWLPYVIVAFIAVIGAVISLLLPETAKIDLPQSFDDAEKLIKNQRFFDMPCLRKNIKDGGHNNVSFEMEQHVSP